MNGSTSLKPRKKLRVSTHFVVVPTLVASSIVYVLADSELTGLTPTTYKERWRLDVRLLLSAHTVYSKAVVVTRDLTPQGAAVLESADTVMAINQQGQESWVLTSVPRGAHVRGNTVIVPNGLVLDLIDGPSGQRNPIVLPVEGDPLHGVGLAGRIGILRATDSSFCGVDLERREAIWNRPLIAELEASLGHPPQLTGWCGDNIVAVAYGRTDIVAVSTVTGLTRWTHPAWVQWGPPTVHEGRLYLWPWTSERPARVLALDLQTGKVIWDVDLGALAEAFSRASEAHSPLVTGNTVVFTTRQGVILMVRRSDGVPLAWYKHSDGLNAPMACGDDVLVTSESGHLLIFEVPE